MLRYVTPVIPTAEWSLPFEGEPPSDIESIVERVAELIRRLAPRDTQGGLYLPDRPRVVTILGGRGTGKSTVLNFAVQRLRKMPSCLVLPVIDPEGFAAGESLGGWVLAHLELALTDHDKSFEISEDTLLGTALQQLRRAYAVRSSAFLAGLETRGLTFEDFGRDAVKLPTRGVRFTDDWTQALEAYAAARGVQDMQLVIPVDDADMLPHILPSIVADAQLLGSSPRTAILFAADADTLRKSLAVATLTTYEPVAELALTHGVISAKSVRDLVSRRLVKYFPRSLRVTIPTPDPIHRLDFSPLERDLSLNSIFSRLTIDGTTIKSLFDLFNVRTVSGSDIAPSEYARALSSNFRDLRQLHETLEGIDPTSRGAASRALYTILSHGLDSVSGDLPPGTEDALSLRLDGAEAAARLNLRNLRFGKTTGNARLVYDGSSAEGSDPSLTRFLFIRQVVAHYCHYDDGQATHTPGTGEGERSDRAIELPEQFAYLLFLAWEAIYPTGDRRPLINNDGLVGRRMPVPGGTAWNDHLAGDTRDSDWPYLTVPAWDTFSDYFAYQRGWDAIHRACQGYDVQAGRTDLLEFVILGHLILVSSVQFLRAVPDSLLMVTPEWLVEHLEPATWRVERDRWLSLAKEGLSDALAHSRREKDQRSADFVGWFGHLLPLAANRAVAPELISAWILDLWQGQSTSSEKQAAVEQIVNVTNSHLDSPLGDSDIALLEGLAPERAKRLRDVREGFAREQENRRVRWLRELEMAKVPQDVVQDLLTSGASKDVTLALMMAGLKPEVLGQLADLFPASPPGDEGRSEKPLRPGQEEG